MNRAGRILAAAVLLLVNGAAGAAARPTPRTPANRDWTRTFAVTPEGGFRMGNPAAKAAIVEYGSLTCPHCRHFAQTGLKPLVQDYVRSGSANYEYRSLVLNGIDIAATLVARCNGPAHFFRVAEKLYATQPVWTGKVEKLADVERKRLESLPQAEMMLEVARITGLIPLAAASGIAPGRAEECLKDKAATDRLIAMYRAAMDRGIKGTPTFFVNGTQVQGIDWPALEPRLRDALGKRG